MLLERPGLTVREMSVTLGCSTTAVIKALSLLDKDKIITRTKVKGRYEYKINYKNARYHPDVRRLIFALRDIIAEENPLPSDLFRPNAAEAYPAMHLTCNEEIVGSIPTSGSNEEMGK